MIRFGEDFFVLAYLQNNNKYSPLQAANTFACRRYAECKTTSEILELSNAVRDLRNAGFHEKVAENISFDFQFCHRFDWFSKIKPVIFPSKSLLALAIE
jgi:hypothetical protein